MLHVNEDEKSPWTARKSKPGPTCKETKAEFLEGKKKLWLTVTRDQLYLHSCHACTYFLWFTSFFTSSKDLCINAPWSSTTRMYLLCYYSFGNQLKIILIYSLCTLGVPWFHWLGAYYVNIYIQVKACTHSVQLLKLWNSLWFFPRTAIPSSEFIGHVNLVDFH